MSFSFLSRGDRGASPKLLIGILSPRLHQSNVAFWCHACTVVIDVIDAWSWIDEGDGMAFLLRWVATTRSPSLKSRVTWRMAAGNSSPLLVFTDVSDKVSPDVRCVDRNVRFFDHRCRVFSLSLSLSLSLSTAMVEKEDDTYYPEASLMSKIRNTRMICHPYVEDDKSIILSVEETWP